MCSYFILCKVLYNVCVKISMYSRPSVQCERPHFGYVRAQVAVHAGAFDAHEHAEIQAGPVRFRGIAVGTLSVAGYTGLDVLHLFHAVIGRVEFAVGAALVDLVALKVKHIYWVNVCGVL